MMDKGKYAAHGTFIKRLSTTFNKFSKPKSALIQPIPVNKARSNIDNEQFEDIKIQSKTFCAKFRFQQNIDKKPVAQQFTTPFLYIEKIIKKQKVDEKLAENKKIEPFVTTLNLKKSNRAKVQSQIPLGFQNLFEYEQEKKKSAIKLFKKMLQADIRNLKDMFFLWHGKNKKTNPQIEVKEKQFIDFFKQILPEKVSQKQLKNFFELYKNKAPKGKQKQQIFRLISIKALSFNYEKYFTSETEVLNILSEKSLKQRYLFVKTYLVQFDKNYKQLKEAMNSIKRYEESLKNHFKKMFKNYRNPYEQEIHSLSKQLQKPIIKYDKYKKQELTSKIQQLTNKNGVQYEKLSQNFEKFLNNYQQGIITNHDLFFTKRTINKLIQPILDDYPYLTKVLVEQRIQKQQEKKQLYLECLSNLIIQIDQDKKHLAEDNFTLQQIANLILNRNKGRKKGHNLLVKYSDEFLLYSSKKLIKQIKKQFLIKFQLFIEDIDAFPSDQQIGLDLLHLCFEMQCTKVLFKNQIWSELNNLIPSDIQAKSKYHQRTIDSNVCLEYVRKYFNKLDEKLKIQLNKSKHISLLAQNITLHDFQSFGTIIEGVINKVGEYNEDQQQMEDKVEPLQTKGKKVSFANIVDSTLFKNNFPQQYKAQEELKNAQQQNIIKSLIKSIYQSSPKKHKQNSNSEIMNASSHYQPNITINNNQENMAENVYALNTLAKSSFIPEGLNTNSFDIRYYQKAKDKEQMYKNNETQFVKLGSSMLLSNLPVVEEIKSEDPLRISRFLMTNIDIGIKEQKRQVKQKEFQESIKEGIAHNYYKDRIKLQNKKTVYDSEGKSKYSVLLPVGYYQNFVAVENMPDEQKWYLRPHHVQTLTQNPLSKKDNIIRTEYQSKMQKIPLKKRPDEFVIEQNVKRKGQLIESLQQRINGLKHDLQNANRGKRSNKGVTVPTHVVNNYMTKLTQQKEGRQLQIASYEGVLYDLRRKQRQLLNNFRDNESHLMGEPDQKWWQRKDKMFNNQLRKDRLLVSDSLKPENKHKQYVQKLKNNEIY